MIIDIAGLPASGKSYFASYFCKTFNSISRGKIIDFIQIDRTTLLGKILHTLFNCFSFFFPFQHQTKKYLAEFTKKRPKYNKAHTLTFFTNRISYIYYIYLIFRIFKLNIIINEGISQVLVTFAVEYNIDEESFRKIVSNILNDLEKVNVTFCVFDISVEKDLKSFKDRNRHVTAIDELKGKELRSFIESYKTFLNIYLTEFHYVKLSRDHSNKSNFSLLMEKGGIR
ncbi:hypothetical protein ACMEOK_14455 [Lactiplantibacillus plantarum]|uniref:hypothetical protein n=1 Tax=Lactiplantibacillus plantarum TaxID=1590 RepID=UPI0039C17388